MILALLGRWQDGHLGRQGVGTSFNELTGLALRPRVVGEGELNAIRDRWVAVKQKDIHGIGFGIAEIHVTQDLEGLRRDLGEVRRETVSDLQAVLVRLMFGIATESAGDGASNERKNRNQEQHSWERSPVIDATHVPLCSRARQDPADAPVAEIEQYK